MPSLDEIAAALQGLGSLPPQARAAHERRLEHEANLRRLVAMGPWRRALTRPHADILDLQERVASLAEIGSRLQEFHRILEELDARRVAVAAALSRQGAWVVPSTSSEQAWQILASTTATVGLESLRRVLDALRSEVEGMERGAQAMDALTRTLAEAREALGEDELRPYEARLQRAMSAGHGDELQTLLRELRAALDAPRPPPPPVVGAALELMAAAEAWGGALATDLPFEATAELSRLRAQAASLRRRGGPEESAVELRVAASRLISELAAQAAVARGALREQVERDAKTATELRLLELPPALGALRPDPTTAEAHRAWMNQAHGLARQLKQAVQADPAASRRRAEELRRELLERLDRVHELRPPPAVRELAASALQGLSSWSADDEDPLAALSRLAALSDQITRVETLLARHREQRALLLKELKSAIYSPARELSPELREQLRVRAEGAWSADDAVAALRALLDEVQRLS